MSQQNATKKVEYGCGVTVVMSVFAFAPVKKVTIGGRDVGVLSVSDGKNNFDVFINDENTYNYLVRNAHKGTHLNITGSLSSLDAYNDKAKARISCLSLFCTNKLNHGKDYVARMNGEGAQQPQQQNQSWGQPQGQQQPNNGVQQQANAPQQPQYNEANPPMDFDDDIPF